MNPEDETLLSAYLDDELDPADRLALEWSIESNPPLADQLKLLTQARDAVAGLSRPGLPVDLAAELSARLVASRRRERFRRLARPAQVLFAFSGFAGIAASLIFAIILLNRTLHDSPRPVEISAEIPSEIRTHLSVPATQNLTGMSDTIRTASKIASFAFEKSRTNLPPLGPRPLDDKRELDSRRTIAGMLEQPNVRRIRIVTDVLDAPEKVKNLIHQDSRLNPEFGRITICQELVIDTDFPEAAEVFAVPMDERDRRAFVAQLTREFPDLVEEADPASPELVTQLTEIGQVALFRGTEAAPLVDPPHDFRPFIANRAEIPQIHIVDHNPGDVDPPARRQAEASGVPSLPVSPSATSPKGPDLKPGDRVTVLVWVVKRPVRRS